MAMQLTPQEIEGIPNKWLEVILHFFAGFRNDTVDFGRPHLRPSVQRIYPIFVVLYAALVICGAACNVALLFSVFSKRPSRPRTQEGPRTVSGPSEVVGERRRSGSGFRDPTLCFLANVAAADVVKCLLVLPVSLAVMLVQNWVFGSFMCFFLPMMQDIPIHVSMLSFLFIAADRHRLLMDPMKTRLPPLFCSIAAWLLALCIVLPYPVYTTYLDLGAFMKDQFEGVGICAVNLGDDMQEYMRGLFIAMGGSGRRSAEDEVDVIQEQRTQKYLIAMVVVFAVCLFPLMVLRLAKLALTETYENSGHFDIAFTSFVWVAFLPTVTTPCLYAAWTLSTPAKERLREYFRFGVARPDEEDRSCVLLGRRLRRDAEQTHSGAGLSNVAFAPQPSVSFREGQCTLLDASSRLPHEVVLMADSPRFQKGSFS